MRTLTLLVCGVALVGLLGGCATQKRIPVEPQGPPPTAISSDTDYRYKKYYVQEGDTLRSIGEKMGIHWRDILRVNDCDTTDLQEGQVLLLPLHAREETGDLKRGGAEPQFKEAPARGKVSIVIDPGHGGKDPGAVSPIGLLEKDVNLAFSLETCRLLTKWGFHASMTRRADEFIELNERAAISNRIRADLFVSIHADSSHNSAARGYSIFVCRHASSRSRSAASAVEEALRHSGIKSRGIREADFRVLVRTDGPAILVECGFLSNRNEATMLEKGATQKRLAQCIASGIQSFFER